MIGKLLGLTLASASPRRRDLLRYLGVTFRAVATDAEEQDHLPPAEVLDFLPPAELPPRWHPTILAWRKADAARALAHDDVILGADTIVVLDDDVLNKPVSPAEAVNMLHRLAGRSHFVYTGMVLLLPTGQTLTALERSEVTIAPLRDDVIQAYVATGEPLDKAGAYGIQGLGGRLVEGVTGSYTNVVGLPLSVTAQLLQQAGFTDLVTPTEAYARWLQDQGKEPLPCPPTHP